VNKAKQGARLPIHQEGGPKPLMIVATKPRAAIESIHRRWNDSSGAGRLPEFCVSTAGSAGNVNPRRGASRVHLSRSKNRRVIFAWGEEANTGHRQRLVEWVHQDDLHVATSVQIDSFRTMMLFDRAISPRIIRRARRRASAGKKV
jgi:hypothetical protein